MSTLLKTAFATYPSVKLKNIEVDKKSGKTLISIKKELLFGDYIQPFLNENGTDYERLVVVEKKKEVEYTKVYCRGEANPKRKKTRTVYQHVRKIIGSQAIVASWLGSHL
ncbi:MAG: hypothetical protein IKI09_08180 [Bacteroidales bacterium]|nr:hypothetical protein [Bacteroidales bacterium]